MSNQIKIHDIKFHEDDRAQRLQDVYKEGMPDTQINISHINSTGHCVGWHSHEKQTEYWYRLHYCLQTDGNACALQGLR